MASDSIASIASDSSPQDQVDWLELAAFINPYGDARLDEIAGSLAIQVDEEDPDIASRDAERDRVRAEIENEVISRSNSLSEAYPFELSSDGEVFRLKPASQRKASCFYLLCLVLSHLTRSAILKKPPSAADIRNVRKRHFQTFATLAVAGLVGGPALSLGWPRESGESILAVATRGCTLSSTGEARRVPARTANPSAKDGGIDVLAWCPLPDRASPSSFWFAQAASGHSWRKKSAKDEVPAFLRDYYDLVPQCNYSYVTICPFLVSIKDIESESFRHGAVLHRKNAAFLALRGLQLAEAGEHVEDAGKARNIALWLGRYRTERRKAEAGAQ